jgi:hypothetical protein
VIDEAPSVLVDVNSVKPEICENCRSRGLVNEEATVTGSAPGKVAETESVGKSICGRGAIGNCGTQTRPSSVTAIISSVVAIGRSMKGVEKLIGA